MPDAADLLLDRRGHGLGDGLGIGARILGANHDGRRRDLGILGDRQAQIGNGADQHDDDRYHRGKDGAIDEEVREVHRRYWVRDAATGGSVVRSGATVAPGRALTMPPTTMVSSPVRPLRTTR